MDKIVLNNGLRIAADRLCSTDYLICRDYSDMVSIHYHRYYELYILVNGNRNILLSDRVFELKAGDVLMVKPFDIHRAIDGTNRLYERYLISFPSDFADRLVKRYPIFAEVFDTTAFHVSPDVLKETIAIYKEIEKEYSNKNDLSNIIVQNLIERMFIRFYKEKQKPNNMPGVKKNDFRLQAALDYIDDNYTKNITLKECADIIFMSKSNFTKIFNSVVGVNLKTYINAKRIQSACEQLCKTDKTVKEISEAVGYENSSYFSSIFKESIGVTPKEYREYNKH